jgi:hypothetical protein
MTKQTTTSNLHPIHQNEDGFFNDSNCQKISLHHPTLDMIHIEDIATTLSKICRFGGKIPGDAFYSVAQHCCLVKYLAPPELARAALLHDATEAYLGDVVKPLKVILGDVYHDLEMKFEKVICEKFSIDTDHLKQIKYWDKRALDIEYNYLYKGEEPLQRIFGHEPCWDHIVAKEMFMADFKEVFNG